MNESGPDGLPPPESFSRCERSVDRSVPVPEPNLKSMASLRASSMMSSMLSRTLWMKQAEPCGYSYGFSGWPTELVSGFQFQLHWAPLTPYMWYRPTLNHTGELKAPC